MLLTMKLLWGVDPSKSPTDADTAAITLTCTHDPTICHETRYSVALVVILHPANLWYAVDKENKRDAWHLIKLLADDVSQSQSIVVL